MPVTGTTLTSISTPPTPAVSADTAVSGKLRPGVEIIRLFSTEEWEVFIQEWATSLKTKYAEVGRFGGAGDMGRDICAIYSSPAPGGDWDNYQCKHYDHPLAPSDVWVELGKLCYYTFMALRCAAWVNFFKIGRAAI
jgi:hypothetical protein